MGKGGVFMLRNIMRRAIRMLWILLVVVIIAMIPWMITSLSDSNYTPIEIAQTIAGVFTLGACVLSIWQMTGHLDNFNDAQLQTPILRILLMVPIYSLNCWLSLMCKDISIYLDTFRKIYEGFVLQQFFVYLTTYLAEKRPWERLMDGDTNQPGSPHVGLGDNGDNREVMEYAIALKLQKREEPQHHIFPFWCLEDWPAEDFTAGCRTGINAYVFCRVVTAIVELLLLPLGWYKPGDLRLDAPYLYITIINNCASLWAIYCLVLFGMALEKHLRPINPLSKFLIIKAVIFFSWWQSVILVIVEDLGLLKNRSSAWTGYDEGDIALGMQDLAICIEMLFVALAHTWAFSYKEHRRAKKEGEEEDERDSFFYRIVRMFDFRDIGEDVGHSLRHGVGPSLDVDAHLAPLLSGTPGTTPLQSPDISPRLSPEDEPQKKLHTSMPTIIEDHESDADDESAPFDEDLEKGANNCNEGQSADSSQTT